jgi:hypothetical protein
VAEGGEEPCREPEEQRHNLEYRNAVGHRGKDADNFLRAGVGFVATRLVVCHKLCSKIILNIYHLQNKEMSDALVKK